MERIKGKRKRKVGYDRRKNGEKEEAEEIKGGGKKRIGIKSGGREKEDKAEVNEKK